MLPGVLLALAMVWSVVKSIAISNWAPGLEILIPVVFPALLVGVLFARQPWLPGWLAHLLGIALGLTWTIQRLDPLLSERLTTWHDQATELLIRTIIWVRVLASGGRGEDTVLFVTALALLSWMLGYTTTWFIFRRGWVWWAILINAMFILVNYAYVLPKPTTLFFIFLATALLLIVYQHITARQADWAAAQVEYPEFLPLRFVTAAAFFCGTIIFGTSLLPSNVSSEQAAQTWQTIKQPFVLARERWEDAFSTINAPPGTSGGNFTSRQSTLGGARLLGDAVVMYVRAPRFEYWRAVAFDKYTSSGWQNTTGEQARFALGVSTPEEARTELEAGMAMPPIDTQGRQLITQTIQLAKDRKDDLVTVAGQAVQMSLPTLVEHDYAVQQNQLLPNYESTSLVISQAPLRAGAVYTVTTLVSVADVQSLRQVEANYPDWVRRRYLQLSDTITPRTIAKAREIVNQANADTPYDQAVAIQNFLRTLPYNESIPAPPTGADPVDYFLFDQQQGYCDYYASAMVMMLRSLGVPARWVQGYAGGIFDAELDAYIVHENIAHSWPEVYFPGYGWQRFEPTPARYTTLPQRPETSADASQSDDNIGEDAVVIPEAPAPDPIEQEQRVVIPEEQPGTDAQASGQPWWERLQSQVALLMLVPGLIGLFVYVLVRRWQREVRGLRPAAAAYAELGLLARWAGLFQSSHMTPYEYAVELCQALPQQRGAIERIVSAYVRERYRRAGATNRHTFEGDLKQLRGPLVRLIFTRLGNIRRIDPGNRRQRRRTRSLDTG